MFITRRQFLKYCAASAAALGLSQTDLLRIEKAMAAVTEVNPDPLNGGELGLFMPRVIWIAGANCSGCATGLLNFVAGYSSSNYHETGTDPHGGNHPADPWGYYHGYSPVQTTVALTEQAWTETEGALQTAASVAGSLDGLDLSGLGLPANYGANGLLDIGDVAMNVISIDYAYIVAAGAGDILNNHMMELVATSPYVLLIEGAIQLSGAGKFCRVFEVPAGKTVTIRGAEAPGPAPKCMAYHNATYVPTPPAHLTTTGGVKTIGEGNEVTMMDTSAWLASQPNCVAVLAMGTCAAWGGIPAAKGNKTGAVSAWEWLHKKNSIMSHWVPSINVPLVNIPGCPPHPDWVVAPIVATILALTGAIAEIGPPPKLYPDLAAAVAGALVAVYGLLDKTLCSTKTGGVADRAKYTYLPLFPKNKTFCDPVTGKCPRFETGPLVEHIMSTDPANGGVPDGLVPPQYQATGRTSSHPNGRCLRGVGCNGWKTDAIGAKADCPTRMFNTHTNWCVGNNYPCQGCTDPNFPDGCSPFFSGAKGKWAGM